MTSTRSRVGVEAEGGIVALTGAHGSFQTVAAVGEAAPISPLSLRVRVPVHHLSLNGGAPQSGLGDVDVRLRWRIKRGDPLQVSVGATVGLPSGDGERQLGDGNAKITPFVTAGWAVASTVLYVTVADQIAFSHAAPLVRDVTDPGSDHEVRFDLGLIERFGDAFFATATASGITVLMNEDRGGAKAGDTLGFGTIQLGVTPDPNVRISVGGSLPVFGQRRFEAKSLASVTVAF